MRFNPEKIVKIVEWVERRREAAEKCNKTFDLWKHLDMTSVNGAMSNVVDGPQAGRVMMRDIEASTMNPTALLEEQNAVLSGEHQLGARASRAQVEMAINGAIDRGEFNPRNLPKKKF